MKYFKYQNLRHQLGISLVEIMVALVISLFLLGGLIQVYLSNKASYSFTNAISRIQENGRYATDIMMQDLRMAGFFGCIVFDPEDEATMDQFVNNLNPNGPGYNPNDYDFLNQPLLSGTDNDGLNGSDSITLTGPTPGNVTVLPPYSSKSANIKVSLDHGLKDDDIVMVSNCRGGDIFQVSGANASNGTIGHNSGSGTPGNYNPDNCKGGNSHCFSQTYGADASIFILRRTTYSIAVGESGEPALWLSSNGDNQELIEGIEQMQVLYGVDTTDDDHPNQYVNATAVTNWYDVMSIRLTFLVRSASDGIVEGSQVVNYNGATATAADRRLRQVFTTTVALRNRVSDT